MKFQVKKVENCFADSETYEYLLPVSGDFMRSQLNGWEIRINEKLRRPVIIAQCGRVILKCTEAGNTFRVSFPGSDSIAEKEKFERFLERIP